MIVSIEGEIEIKQINIVVFWNIGTETSDKIRTQKGPERNSKTKKNVKFKTIILAQTKTKIYYIL